MKTLRQRNLFDTEDWLTSLPAAFPASHTAAGLRKGKEDDRHLWPEMLRVIREVQPDWVLGENVLGIISWSKGMVFNGVQTDLEAAGYEVFPYVLPACGIDAPHRRDRVWFVAHAINSGYRNIRYQDSRSDGLQGICGTGVFAGKFDGAASRIFDTDTNDQGLQGGEIIGSIGSSREKPDEQLTGLFQSAWEKFPTEPPLCGADDGISDRVQRIKALGNSMVPQVVYQIFKAIQEYENLKL